MHNFPWNSKISLQIPTFPGKELPKFPTFSHCDCHNYLPYTSYLGDHEAGKKKRVKLIANLVSISFQIPPEFFCMIAGQVIMIYIMGVYLLAIGPNKSKKLSELLSVEWKTLVVFEAMHAVLRSNFATDNNYVVTLSPVTFLDLFGPIVRAINNIT